MPTEVLREGSTIDLFVMELSIGYETFLNKSKENGQTIGHGLSQEELQAMLDNVKGKKEGNASKNS